MKTWSANVDRTRFGPWAVVTGASAGIGREFARQLAANGINVVLVARREALLHELGRELAARHGVEHRVVAVDLTRPDHLARTAEATDDLDIGLVVSNAGAAMPGEFLTHDLDALHAVVRLNAVASLDVAHHFGRRLARRGRGGLILVSAAGSGPGVPNMGQHRRDQGVRPGPRPGTAHRVRAARRVRVRAAPRADRHPGTGPTRLPRRRRTDQTHVRRTVRRRRP